MARAFEDRFAANAWPAQWRDGVFDFHHYHSTAHEALGFAAGAAWLMLGGSEGLLVKVEAGDALLLPAGVGHCRVEQSEDFQVVGAYPRGQSFDICRSAPSEEQLAAMARLQFPGKRSPRRRGWPVDPALAQAGDGLGPPQLSRASRTAEPNASISNGLEIICMPGSRKSARIWGSAT